MSSVASNPAVADGKNSKRKKGRGGESVANVAAAKTEASVNGADSTAQDSEESPYVKELQKTVRNLRKKIANTEKAQSILKENPGKSLDELLADRKLNADQKKQLENKPGVETHLKQTEEQLEQYRKFEEDMEKRTVKKGEVEREELKKEHQEALQALDTEHGKAVEKLEQEFKSRLLMLSRFLRTAAARRQAEDKLPENDAFEGVLLQLYGGDTSAVEAMENLINGEDASVSTVEGEASGYTFKQIRDVVREQASEMEAGELPSAAAEGAPESDPTIVNAGLTEIEQEIQPVTEAIEVRVVPEAATVDADAANAAATSLTSPQDLTASGTTDTWVEVRNPDETDNGLNATPAAITNQESWAEDVPVDTAVVQPTPAPNDGFSEVKHGRGGRERGRGRGGRGRGEGGYRGRGRGGGGGGGGAGGFRGDGDASSYRGRGRGRGGAGGHRGGRGGQGGGEGAPPAKP